MVRIKGVYNALVTPVIDGKVNERAMNRLVDHVLDNGCSGLVVLGGTGEYCGLNASQRIDAIKAAVSANGKRVPLVAGVISPGLPEVIEMGQKSKELGADALMVVTPYYVIASQQGLIDYYEAVMKEIDLPLVLYNIPYRTMVNLLPETVEKLLDRDKAGKIIGIKECTPNMGQALDLLSRIRDRISFICGEEYMFLTEVACGGDGAILASSNLLPKVWSDLFKMIKSGDIARASEIVLQLTPVLRQVFAESNPGPLKHGMRMIGIDCGLALSPLTSVSASLVERLEKELRALLDWYS